jgi:RecA-family ATPase
VKNSLAETNGAQAQATAKNGATQNGTFTRSTSTAQPINPPADFKAEERAIIRTLTEHPKKLASQLLDKLEVLDFREPSHALIIKAAKECKADKLDTTNANLEVTLTAATGEAATVEERSGLIEALATLQEIDLEEYSKETGTQAQRHADKLAADFEKRITATAPEAAPPFKLHSFKDLQKIPRLQWLIRGILLESIASALTAKSGDFKSFIALCMALSIATGRAWYGHEVKQGNVVYVAAEGFYTMLDRATAWAQYHECELPENFHIVKAPVNLADPRTVAAFMESIEAAKPAFVVLDTLSQCAIGMNENDNAAMADFVRGMMSLGNAIGAHVQVLHHNAKATGTFRGAGSFGANLDAHISLDRPENDEEGNTIFVRSEKQRGKQFESFALRGEEILLPYADEYGDPITALVFEPCGEVVTAKVEKHANSKRADKTRAALMEVFDRQFEEATAKGFDGVKVGFWKEAVEEADEPICKTATFWAYRTKLDKDGTIVQCGTHNGSPVYRRGNVTPTTPTTPIQSYQSEPINASEEYSNNSNNPLGVGVVGVPLAEGQELDKTLPGMPKAKKAKKQNPKSNSEAYKSEEFI